ncbi:MAG TPA: tetratricopeptide repeat protein [Polyangia bacterium]|nr:tetratricopeptide repeat protein [Polyangia bacterium]
MEKDKLVLGCVLALVVAGCASSGGAQKPKGPENEPVAEEGGGKGGAAARGPQKPLSEEVSAPVEKPKVAASLSDTEAFDSALEKAQKILGEGPLTSGKCSQAASLFEAVADKNPKIASARYNQGLLYDKCGQLEKAERAYKQALEMNPRYANALGGLGVVAWKKGDRQGAENYFRQALGIDQRCLPALVNMAVLLRERALRTGDANAVRDAQDDVRRALAVDGENMSAYTTLALIYYDLAGGDKSKLEMAETVIAQATKKNDHYAPLWNVSGLVALKKKNVTRALRDFRRAVELDPGFVEAHMNIGAITLSFRDYVSAEQSFKTVLKRDPRNVDAVIGLGVAYRGQRKIKEAEEQYQAAAKLDPRNCAVPYNMGLLYQDYMGTSEAELRKAQGFYREFVSRCSNERDKVAEAERRTKNIDETFAANAEMKRLEQEAARIQKMQEEQQRQQQQQEKKQPGSTAPQPAAGSDGNKAQPAVQKR